MIVVHHLPGTRSVRVRWLCAEARLDAETRLIAYPPTAGFLELNPFGTVPLVEVDGLRLFDSAAALIYLAQSRNLNDLLPASDAPGYGDVLNWTILGESQLGMHANVLLAARFLGPEGGGDTWSTTFSRDRLLRGLAAASSQLCEHPYLLGERFTLADISVGYMTGVARMSLELEAHMPANLIAWHDRLLERPALRQVTDDG